MKNLLYIVIVMLSLSGASCKKSLTEIPLDFYTPENSYTNKSQFESALAGIYAGIRSNFYATTDSYANYDMLGLDVDLAYVASGSTGAKLQYFGWNTLNEDNGFSSTWWQRLYRYVSLANVIIDRAEAPTAVWASEEEKNAIVGEARFIRAFAYRFLANMWGDVPLVLEETRSPKFDYARALQQQVYEQCKEDLEFAAEHMPTINQVKGGRASAEAANHLLAEIYICLKDYKSAITAASRVIDGPNCQLMTSRFGAYADFEFSGYDHLGPLEPWGDVYWDLFRDGNFNWQEGNREAIWNISQDPAIRGGNNTDVNPQGGYFVIERWWGPLSWQARDINNVSNWLMDTLHGRPVGGLIVSGYADTLIWNYKGDFDRDIRNSQYNIQRDYYFTNPASNFYGQKITPGNVDASTITIWPVRLSPHYKKFVPVVPKGMAVDATSGKKNDNGRSWQDWYIMRLAETYLLRAEAHMLDNNPGAAALDINAIRNRANATPVEASDVNMDLILDERARELYGEEFRLNTLMRVGKLVEYLTRYNGYILENGLTVPDRVKKMPIPRREIEANTGSVLEQNDGY